MSCYESLPKSCFSKICRTCLINTDLFLIHEVTREGINLMNILKDWTFLEVENDEFPKQMCNDCIECMYRTYHFLKKCHQSQIILKNIISQESLKNDVDKIKKETNEEISNDIGQSNIDNTFNDDADSKIDIKSDIYDNEDRNDYIPPNDNIINKIQSVKNQISEIRIKNRLRIRKMAKAQLVGYTGNLPKQNKRAYVIQKGPPFTCLTCDSSYQTYEDLKKHKIETKHKRSLRFQCQYCQKKFDSYCKYEEHVRTHTGEKPNRCPTCGKCFNFKFILKRHMLLHMEIKPYRCQFCNKDFTRRQYLKDHERKHTGERLLCSFCGKGFASSSTLSNHEKIHKGATPTGCIRNPMSEDQVFQCNFCDKVLSTDLTLKAHLLLHGPKNFNCEICGKTYITNNRLQNHIRLTHQEHKYCCQVCGKKYKQESTVISHMKTHTGQNKYPCEICGKNFLLKRSLLDHMRIHTGDTTYQCKECLHICINKFNLENHMRVHTGEKPFICPYCGKPFAQEVNMRAHAKIHTGEKNHICGLCSKAFYNNRELKKHMAIHTKNGDSENDFNK